jgi:hypothetical protein
MKGGAIMKNSFLLAQPMRVCPVTGPLKFRAKSPVLCLVFCLVLCLLLCLLVAGSYAQDSSRFQSVGGEYGRKVISTIKADENQTTVASDTNSTLWSWGSSPKGTLVSNGNLIGDPRYTMKRLNVVSNWLGESLTDPYSTANYNEYTYTDAQTGESVKTYTDPTTGEPYYTYTDPTSGKLVNIYFNPLTGVPTRASFAPGSSQPENGEGKTQSYSLPPIFN